MLPKLGSMIKLPFKDRNCRYRRPCIIPRGRTEHRTEKERTSSHQRRGMIQSLELSLLICMDVKEATRLNLGCWMNSDIKFHSKESFFFLIFVRIEKEKDNNT